MAVRHVILGGWVACSAALVLHAGCRRAAPPPPAPTPTTAISKPAAAQSAATSSASAARGALVAGGIEWAGAALQRQAFDLSAWERTRRLLASATTQAAADLANDPRAMMAAGDHALARNDYLTADRCFRRACQLAPDDLDCLQGLAVVLATTYQYDKAADVYRQIIAITRRIAASQSSSWSAATGPAVDVDRINRTARFNLAVAVSRLGDFEQAATIYKGLLSDEPENVPAAFNLATLYQAQGKLAEARDAWRQVVDRSDAMTAADAAFAAAALGQILLDLQEPKQAVEAFVRATKLAPDDPSAWVNLSAARRANGELGLAAAAIRQAIALAPASEDGYERLGGIMLDMYRASQRRQLLADALAAWRKSLEINPNQPALQRQVAQYEAILKATTSSAPGK
ncbi:MAG: tetratricopeptide repeat protein [Phycisphaerae bacterium]